MGDLALGPALAGKRDRMEAELRASHAGYPHFRQMRPTAKYKLFRLAGLHGETVVMAMDLAGISVSAGAACSSGKVSRSRA